MEGFLDHLPAHSASLLHKKKWTRRFFRLNPAFQVLEFFENASMAERKGKIDLQKSAQVVTADELGGLLFTGDGDSRRAQLSSKISIENSRRFVIRVSEYDATKKQLGHHFLCAEVTGNGGDDGQVNPQMSRQYMQQWLQALQQVARDGAKAAGASAAVAPFMGPRELSNRIAAYMDHMHLAACVSGREIESKKSVFEFSVKAWTLQRELVAGGDDDDSDGGDSRSDASQLSSSSWQVLEYACAWKVRKTTAQLRDFDTQLRQFFSRELRDLAFPSSSASNGVVQHLIHSNAYVEAETQRRVALVDTYLQQLLRLPAFSAFGSDASIMLDNFLEITPHFASFRQIEKASGQNLQLRKRKVVSWSEREHFEELYRMHLDAAKAQIEKSAQRRVSAQRSSLSGSHHHRRPSSKNDERRRHSKKQHEHHHHRSSKSPSSPDPSQRDEKPGAVVPPVPVCVRQPSVVEVRSSTSLCMGSLF